ncbi:hypothetical protein CYLTODRAFT_392592 [Cylindrobasidium torrendii FP15055 ss-10]|uniref:Wax synthase domain-containing protein n=1 Tax=Cylindrobasidium torrendii FP15055 ss-10 TaxID=1314674 RepID=A0A0D7BJ48_9AGAR|nr:hypothetical protein CYLTODRAFT_392592 [Cylindrobasidium torrendii FP15055 ss-10]
MSTSVNSKAPTFHPALYLVFPNIVLIVALAANLRLSTRLALVIAHTALSLKAVAATTGRADQDYMMGAAVSELWLTAVHLLLCVTPIRDYKHEDDSEQTPDGWLARLYWCACVKFSQRGIGWNYEVNNVPKRPTSTRRAFLLTQAVQLLLYFLLMDACRVALDAFPVLRTHTGDWEVAMLSSTLTVRVIRALICGCVVMSSIKLQYLILSIGSVAAHINEPKDWPDVFGSWSNATTLAGFWGKTWHKIITRYATGIATRICHFIGVNRGTSLFYVTYVVVVFHISGLHHSGGDAMARRSLRYLWSTGPYFQVQCALLILEYGAIRAFERLGLNHLKVMAGSKKPSEAWDTRVKMLRFAWVFMALALPSHLFVDGPIEAGGALLSSLGPFSPVGSVLRYFGDV